jgi:hypothetical protein
MNINEIPLKNKSVQINCDSIYYLIIAALKSLNCPFQNCEQVFNDKDNLISHVETHV